MIQGTTRIVRTIAVALATVVAISICSAEDVPERFRIPHPETALVLSQSHTSRISLNAGVPSVMKLEAPRQRSFYQDYLIPGLEKQLSRVGVLHTWVLDRPDLGHHTDHDDLAAISERMFEKGAGRALRSYLSEITGLDTMALNLAGRNGKLADSGDEARFHLGVGISSAMPRIDLGYRIGTLGNLRLSLCADGAIDLNYGRYGRLSATRFYAGYDSKEGTADAGLRISF